MNHKIEDITPRPGFVLIKPEEVEETVSGIYQPNKEEEVPQWGKVIAFNQNKLNEDENSEDIEVGQTVIYRKWGGNDVQIGKEKYYFLKFEEIIGIIK